MLRKLVAAINPFHKPAPARSTVQPYEAHPHSFSCPCAVCVSHTNELTVIRIRRQTAGR